jgi:hypothetical protein
MPVNVIRHAPPQGPGALSLIGQWIATQIALVHIIRSNS